ncbi:helix-turn-helix transcriptional regulator [Niabella ginsengisoli]|uniref:Helix-turn-helix transcriptional regulator n=1 Tax=Niabella ginsengisoli TaxID=522298 RepID=A0ABS9SHW1_9BACT|nr:helix-turn-helix transcriptional regulator [Niabella ginsengisoli]MCH5597947.1 helix-turn-helix transcriptional regulator [Niabella ginsengisoli]
MIISVSKGIKNKYGTLNSLNALEEWSILLSCLAPWIALPLIAYFNISQAVEVLTTNTGFLLLFALHLKYNVRQLRNDYYQLKLSEAKLQTWNEALQVEVDKRTSEIERLSKEERFKIKCKQFSLTQREKEIALLVLIGNTYKQVAEQLYITERTVAKHIQNIFEKVNASNKTEMCNKLGT